MLATAMLPAATRSIEGLLAGSAHVAANEPRPLAHSRVSRPLLFAPPDS
jgi:hypothetical protein